MKTWYNITKANSSHCDEAKVESIKEHDILVSTEEGGTNAQKKDQNQKTPKCNG